MSNLNDKRELLKLKQGLIEEEEAEIIIDEEKPYYEKPKGFAAISNFFYHYKLQVIIAAFFIVVGGFLVIDTLNREKADIKILLISTDPEVSSAIFLRQRDIKSALELYTPDFDENGYVFVESFYIDLVDIGRNPESVQGNTIKLFGEIQDGSSLIFMGNRHALEDLLGGQLEVERFYLNLGERYSDNPHIVDGYFYRVKGSPLMGAASMLASCPEDLFIAFRDNVSGARVSGERAVLLREQALIVLDNIVNDTPVERGDS